MPHQQIHWNHANIRWVARKPIKVQRQRLPQSRIDPHMMQLTRVYWNGTYAILIQQWRPTDIVEIRLTDLNRVFIKLAWPHFAATEHFTPLHCINMILFYNDICSSLYLLFFKRKKNNILVLSQTFIVFQRSIVINLIVFLSHFCFKSNVTF